MRACAYREIAIILVEELRHIEITQFEQWESVGIVLVLLEHHICRLTSLCTMGTHCS